MVDLDQSSQQKVDRVVRNAARTIALVGFPNSGKTAYLTALGKELRRPQGNEHWKVVGHSEDIFRHVQNLLMQEQEGQTWDATLVQRAPEPLNLFRARRLGLLHWRTSAFDTSGEHYLAIAYGREFPDNSASQHYAETLREKVLPRCPGIMALMDSSLSQSDLAKHVNHYLVLFNRIHKFGYGTDEAKPAPKPKKTRPQRTRLPVAFALTKVDLLEGREVSLSSRDSAYLKYLRQHGRDPAQAGLSGADGKMVTYPIRTEVFLDRARFPDPAEGQAIIEDYVLCCMRPLAEMVRNMRNAYDVKLFPVSAWGKALATDGQGKEMRPDVEEIEPAGILEPQFWLLERIYLARRLRLMTRLARVAVLAVALALAIGPGLFWALYAGARDRVDQGELDQACSLLVLANHNPYTRFVQSQWEPQANQRLVDLDFEAIRKLRDAGSADQRAQAKRLIGQARSLGASTRRLDEEEAQIHGAKFVEEANAKSLAPRPVWEAAKEWLDALSRLAQGPQDREYNEAVEQATEALRQKKAFDDAIWRAFAEALQRRANLLRPDLAGTPHYFLAKCVLEEGRLKRPTAGSSASDWAAAINLFKQADGEARQSADPALMAECYGQLVDANGQILKSKQDAAKKYVEGGEFEKVLEHWAEVLSLCQGYPPLIRESRAMGQALVNALRAKAKEECEKKPEKPDFGLADKALGAATKIAAEITGQGADEARELMALHSIVLVHLGAEKKAEGKMSKKEIEDLFDRSRTVWKASLTPDAAAKPASAELEKRRVDVAMGYYRDKPKRLDKDDLQRIGYVPKGRVLEERVQELMDAKDYEPVLDLLMGPEASDLSPAVIKESLTKIANYFRETLEGIRSVDELPKDSENALGKLKEAAGKHGETELAKKVEAWIKDIALWKAHKPLTDAMVRAGDFYIDRKEVTVAEYRKFLASLAPQEKAKRMPSFSSPNVNGGKPVALDDPDFQWAYGDKNKFEDSPVVGVSQEDARAYAAWCGKRLPLLREYQALAEKLPDLAEDEVLANNPVLKVTVEPLPPKFKDTRDDVCAVAGNVRKWCGGETPDGQAPVFGMYWSGLFRPDWKKATEMEAAGTRDHHTGFRCASDLAPPGLSGTMPWAPATPSPPAPGPQEGGASGK